MTLYVVHASRRVAALVGEKRKMFCFVLFRFSQALGEGEGRKEGSKELSLSDAFGFPRTDNWKNERIGM